MTPKRKNIEGRGTTAMDEDLVYSSYTNTNRFSTLPKQATEQNSDNFGNRRAS